MAKQMIKPMINTLTLARLSEYCQDKGLGRDFVIGVALEEFLSSDTTGDVADDETP